MPVQWTTILEVNEDSIIFHGSPLERTEPQAGRLAAVHGGGLC